MTDQHLTMILTASFSIIGAIVGYAFSACQSKKSFERQKETIKQNRNWERQDTRRNYRLLIKERRCDQAEKFVEAMTEDFHQIRIESIKLLRPIKYDDFREKIFHFADWQEKINKKVFAYGPVISAMSDGVTELVDAWVIMEKAWKNMEHHYKFIFEEKIIKHTDKNNIDGENISKAIHDVYGDYNKGLSEFYKAIDKIRAKGA